MHSHYCVSITHTYVSSLDAEAGERSVQDTNYAFVRFINHMQGSKIR